MGHQIALVGSPSVPPDILAGLGAALNKQAQQLSEVWGLSAVVTAFPDLESVPTGYWPISLVEETPEGVAGIHRDHGGTPYALVQLGDNWPLVASHECLEMLVDPLGKRTMRGPSP